jgi:hypothetical protein
MKKTTAMAVVLLFALGSCVSAATWGADKTYDASYGLLPNNPNGLFPGFTRELDSADAPNSGGQYGYSTQTPATTTTGT